MAANAFQEHQTNQRLVTLTTQNARLTETLKKYKAQVAALEGAITQHDNANKEHAETLLCVNRIWDQINKDIEYMCQRSGAGPAAADAAPSSEDPSLLEGMDDPYLRRLLAGDPPSLKKVQQNHKALLDDLTDAEKVLLERANTTKAALSQVLALIQQQQQQPAAPTSEADGELAQQQQQVVELQQQLDGARALQRSTESILKLADDRLYEAEENIKALKNQLADKEQALENELRRRMRLQQEAKPGQGPSAGPAAAAPAPAGVGPEGAAASGPSSSRAAGQGVAGTAAVGAGGGVDAQEMEEAQERLQELQQLLELRTADLEKEQQAHQKAIREAVELRERLQEEAWVPHTVTFQGQRKELVRLMGELEGRSKEVEKVVAERDDKARQLAAFNQQGEMKLLLEKRLAAATAQVQELQQKQVELLGVKHSLEQAVMAEKAAAGRGQTSEELKAMIMALHKEVDGREAQLKKHQVAGQRIDASVAEVAAAHAQVAACQTRVELLQRRLRAKTEDMLGAVVKEVQLQERIADQQAFIEVITTFTKDPREVVEVRKSEKELQIKLKQLQQQAQVQEHEAKLAAALEAEADLRQQLDAAHGSIDSLKGEVAGLQLQVEELQAQMVRVREETDTYVKEIGDANEAYETMQEQNTRLLQQATEKDSQVHELMAQKLALEQQLELLKEQALSMRAEAAKLGTEAVALNALKEATDKDFAKATGELAAAREQVRVQATNMERLGRELRAKDEERAGLVALLDKEREVSSNKTKRLEEEEATLAKERSKRQRLEGEHQACQAQLERMRSKGAADGAAEELEEENKALHKLLNCNICSSNRKEVIITKCWHMFCHDCIKKNLDSRNRKCPGCQHPFSNTDVKQFYFT